MAKKSDHWEFEVLNFERWNPNHRSGGWFRLEPKLIFSVKWDRLSNKARSLVIYLWCLRATLGQPLVAVRSAVLVSFLKCKPKSLPMVALELVETEWFRIVTNPLNIPTNNTYQPRERVKPEPDPAPKNQPGRMPAKLALPPLALCWNDHCQNLAKVQKSNHSRNRRAETRWNEYPESDWVEIVQRIARSKFCNGDNDRGWVATFDWLLQPDTALKVMEGKYDNRSAGGSPAADFDHQARRVMAAVSHISSDRWMRDAPEYLGPELWGVLQSQGINISQLRLAPGNEFTIKQLATRLRGGTNVSSANVNTGGFNQLPDVRSRGSDDPSTA